MSSFRNDAPSIGAGNKSKSHLHEPPGLSDRATSAAAQPKQRPPRLLKVPCQRVQGRLTGQWWRDNERRKIGRPWHFRLLNVDGDFDAHRPVGGVSAIFTALRKVPSAVSGERMRKAALETDFSMPN